MLLRERKQITDKGGAVHLVITDYSDGSGSSRTICRLFRSYEKAIEVAKELILKQRAWNKHIDFCVEHNLDLVEVNKAIAERDARVARRKEEEKQKLLKKLEEL